MGVVPVLFFVNSFHMMTSGVYTYSDREGTFRHAQGWIGGQNRFKGGGKSVPLATTRSNRASGRTKNGRTGRNVVYQILQTCLAGTGPQKNSEEKPFVGSKTQTTSKEWRSEEQNTLKKLHTSKARKIDDEEKQYLMNLP